MMIADGRADQRNPGVIGEQMMNIEAVRAEAINRGEMMKISVGRAEVINRGQMMKTGVGPAALRILGAGEGMKMKLEVLLEERRTPQ